MNITVRRGRGQRSSVISTQFTPQVAVGQPRALVATPPPRIGRRAHSASIATRTVAAHPPPPPPTTAYPPHIVTSQTHQRRKLGSIYQTRTPAIPPLPASGKTIVGGPPARQRTTARQAVMMITRRDRGMAAGQFIQPKVGGPQVRQRRPARTVILASPGTPYPKTKITHAFLSPIFYRFALRRHSPTLKTPFYPRRPFQRLVVAVPPLRQRTAPRGGVVVRSPYYAAALHPRSAQTVRTGAPHPLLRARLGRAPVLRSALGNAILPAVKVSTPPARVPRAKPPTMLRTSYRSERPRQAIAAGPRRPHFQRPAIQGITLATRTGSSGGRVPTPRVRVFAVPARKPRLPHVVSFKSLLKSPVLTNPMPVIRVRYGGQRPRTTAPSGIIVRNPTPAASGLPVDFPDAFCQWLINQPIFVTAFNWSSANDINADWDDPGSSYPYLVYREPEGTREYISDRSYIEEGQIAFAVVANSKQQARSLSETVALFLQDAPLEWQGGSLFFFRWRNPSFPPVHESGSQAQTWVWRRIMLFDYKFEGHLPT